MNHRARVLLMVVVAFLLGDVLLPSLITSLEASAWRVTPRELYNPWGFLLAVLPTVWLFLVMAGIAEKQDPWDVWDSVGAVAVTLVLDTIVMFTYMLSGTEYRVALSSAVSKSTLVAMVIVVLVTIFLGRIFRPREIPPVHIPS